MVKRNGLLSGGVPQPFNPGSHMLLSGPPRRLEDRGQRGAMKPTTDAMHRGLSRAVLDLRARMRWGQLDLAEQIGKHGGRVIDVAGGKIVVEEPCAKDTGKKCKTTIGGEKDASAADEDLSRKPR